MMIYTIQKRTWNKTLINKKLNVLQTKIFKKIKIIDNLYSLLVQTQNKI